MKHVLIFGGQAGSEGKGQVAYDIGRKIGVKKVVTVNPPNAGHTVYPQNYSTTKFVFRQLPTAALCETAELVHIGRGALIIPALLTDELEVLFREKPNIKVEIHRDALVIEHRDKLAEMDGGFNIGSTRKGVGACLARSIGPERDTILRMGDLPEFKSFMVDSTKSITTNWTTAADPTILEGSQGWALDRLASPYKPYTTSNGVTPDALCWRAGIPSTFFQRRVAVVRTRPIRVHGNSGPLGGEETTWDAVGAVPEITTVTKKERRVFEWSHEDYVKMCRDCNPTDLAMTFLDYLTTPSRELMLKTYWPTYQRWGPRSKDHEFAGVW